MVESNLSDEERTKRATFLLRQIDKDVKENNFDAALEKIRTIYEYDIKNVYARAYEQRILTMIVEHERKATLQETQHQVEEKVDQEVKRQLRDFYQRQEQETQKRNEDERTENTLERRAREASVNEVQEVAAHDISAIQEATAKRIGEVEKKLLTQIDQGSAINVSSSNSATIKLRAEFEARLQAYKRQVAIAETKWKKIQQEAFEKLKRDQQRAQKELIQQMEDERTALLYREGEKAKYHQLDAYRSLMTLMIQLAVPAEWRHSILQSLKISFSLNDTEHMEIERSVQVNSYIEALRSLWEKGTPPETDQDQLTRLQQFYHISESEHAIYTKQVKKSLGLTDDTAIIVVIDDDPSIRKYVEHILRKTYRTVFVLPSVESALPVIEKTPPSLILSDINLGTGAINGFAFFEKLSAGAYGETVSHVPFVLMSSMENEDFIKQTIQAGVRAYLSKPFTRETLEKVAKSVLG